MRALLSAIIVVILAAVGNLPLARAEKTLPAATQPAEVTLTGSLACAVCELHEKGAKGHQDALVVKNGATEVTYFLIGDQNVRSISFADGWCMVKAWSP